jgi:hypothetical protein
MDHHAAGTARFPDVIFHAATFRPEQLDNPARRSTIASQLPSCLEFAAMAGAIFD